MLSRIISSLPAAASITALVLSAKPPQSEQFLANQPQTPAQLALRQRLADDDLFGLKRFRPAPIGEASMRSGFAVELSSF